MCCEMRPRFGFEFGSARCNIWRNWPALCSRQQQLAASFGSEKKVHITTASMPSPNTRKKSKVIVISGPTGAGKSRLALEVAKRLGGEIISADSVQVYRSLDNGSAKPTASEMNMVPHHSIDIMHASEDYSAGISLSTHEEQRKMFLIEAACQSLLEGLGST